MIAINDVRDKVIAMGYYPSDELLYDMYNALVLFNTKAITNGQDIYALCLEGPPGAGKTAYADTYAKLSNELFGNVELVEYQCDPTTGKTELFEDINISAAIRGDADNVNIPGKLIDAIKKVNNGKKVVLFLDEYDKAREETDSFLLQFLQSGKLNSTQHGDLAIKDEYKGNLQVIFCKNDNRKELSGPLSRRVRIIRLDYMEPAIFYKVAHRNLVEEKDNPVSEELLNLVSLMYESAYNNRDIFNRLPSCSEMMIAILDADRLLKSANAPQYIIYNTIIRSMFKSPDDITTFESSINNNKKNKLYEVVNQMKETAKTEDSIDLHSLIAEKIFAQESGKYTKKVDELEKLIDEYNNKFAEIEKNMLRTVEGEIRLQNGNKLIADQLPKAVNIFEDQSKNIKRGFNIYDLANGEWTKVATVNRPKLNTRFALQNIMEHLDKLDITLFDNGILLYDADGYKIIAVNELSENGDSKFTILSNYPILPSVLVSQITKFKDLIKDIYHKQLANYHDIDRLTFDALDNTHDTQLEIDTLIYNDNSLDMEKVQDNLYHYVYNSNDKDNKDYSNDFKCNPADAIALCNKITINQGKVLKNELR